MSGCAKKLLQEMLRHELNVTATPRSLFMYMHAYMTISKRQLEAVYSSVKDQLQGDDTLRGIYCRGAETLSPAIAYSLVTHLYTHIFSIQYVLGSTCLFILYFQNLILSYIHNGKRSGEKSSFYSHHDSSGSKNEEMFTQPESERERRTASCSSSAPSPRSGLVWDVFSGVSTMLHV